MAGHLHVTGETPLFMDADAEFENLVPLHATFHTFSKVVILKVKANVLHILNWHVFYIITNNNFISSQKA